VTIWDNRIKSMTYDVFGTMGHLGQKVIVPKRQNKNDLNQLLMKNRTKFGTKPGTNIFWDRTGQHTIVLSNCPICPDLNVLS
jgi:hypothetical protein